MRVFLLLCNYFFQKIKLMNKVKFYGMTIIYNDKNSEIIFGNKIEIKSSFFSNFIGLNHRSIIIARDGGKIEIDDNIGISGATIYSRKRIKIGKNTLIGGNCKIIDNDFHPLNTFDRINKTNEKIKSKEIIIGENCFLGVNSIILKGTILGDNCIVGAGSVVSGIFPKDSIIVGNPGKIKKN
ncbi:MAG: acyltransferase [Bacilli bacterium]